MITKDYVAEVVKHCLVSCSENEIFVSAWPHVKSVSLRAYVGGWGKGDRAACILEFFYDDETWLNKESEKELKERIEKFIEKYAK